MACSTIYYNTALCGWAAGLTQPRQVHIMNAQLARVRKRRRELLEELANIEQMRRGSLCSQLFEATRKDATKVYRGPYPLYTYKEKGKTLSRRITNPEELGRYREQIDAFRRFQTLVSELVRVGQRISDLVLSDEEELKKRSRRRKE